MSDFFDQVLCGDDMARAVQAPKRERRDVPDLLEELSDEAPDRGSVDIHEIPPDVDICPHCDDELGANPDCEVCNMDRNSYLTW